MKSALSLLMGLAIFSLLSVSPSIPAAAYASAAVPSTIASYDANVLGVKVHYTMAGHGPAVVLLHGYAETSRMWMPIIPVLAARFTVIVPDLPGIGDSAIPAQGLDMKTAAIRIHELARSLGVSKARVVGHDIGLMVAYAYAAQFPSETEKLVVMDAFLPGVAGWEGVYNNPGSWHFRFHGSTPEALVQGTRAHLLRLLLERVCRRQDLVQFPKLTARPTLRPMRVRGACARAGDTSIRFRKRPTILRNSRRPG